MRWLLGEPGGRLLLCLPRPPCTQQAAHAGQTSPSLDISASPALPEAPQGPFLRRPAYTPVPSLAAFAFSATPRSADCRLDGTMEGGHHPPRPDLRLHFTLLPAEGGRAPALPPPPPPHVEVCGRGDQPRGQLGAVGGPARAGWGGGAETLISGHGDQGLGSFYLGGGHQPTSCPWASLACSVPNRCFLLPFCLHSRPWAIGAPGPRRPGSDPRPRCKARVTWSHASPPAPHPHPTQPKVPEGMFLKVV
ncbi:unnamed protein product [Rangifer tarandus platyrhynchus]|uniref:Uncharacterized protein n=2 Tax=Rangifer tarandus platyrhynchus TaxID=3082113 RepID=A0ABN8ZIH0_RANTA|nr:unnamed protein product [Rangifer tarandus platyrhynchus]CAI9708217.1 unnamed protein product [Rangifer tarandus platyrhynchus]